MVAKRNFNWKTVCFVIFLLAWTVVAMTASQLIIGVIMLAILRASFSQPLWTCIYYALTYILSIIFIIYLPPRLYKLLQKTRINLKAADSDQKADKDSKSKAAIPASGNEADANPLATNSEELGMQHLPTFVDIGLAPIGYVVYLALSMLFTTLMSVFTWFNAEEAQDVGFNYVLTGPNRIIAMIALVFIAPIAEEIIMRGWLYGKLRSKLSLPLAIILTSLLFGFLHGQWNIAVGVFALSLVLCSLREITGTIWSGILLHMLSNGIAFYLLYVAIF